MNKSETHSRAKTELLEILSRMDENIERRSFGLPSVGEATSVAAERLGQKYGLDSDIYKKARNLANLDLRLDDQAYIQEYRSLKAARN